MKKNVIWAIFLYLIQPTFILGLLATWINYKKRVEYSRKKFRVNFIRNNFEIKDYLLKGILPGIIISGITLLMGTPLTIEWYILYVILTSILLITSGVRFIHPIFTFPLATISLFVTKYFKIDLNFNWLTDKLNQKIFLSDFGNQEVSLLAVSTLIFLALILLISTIFIKNKDENKNYPLLKNSKRGKSVAVYQNKLLWLMPLIVLVPGQVIKPFASWWPMLNIGAESYAVLFLPALIGLHYKISTQFIENATIQLKKELQIVGGFSLILAGISYFYPKISIIFVSVLFLMGGVILYRHWQREKNWTFKYGPVDRGLRIIAVRPDSPAERMGIVIGDVITDINDYQMNTINDFNEVIAYNRSYVHMRIKRKDGEIIIAETPLYDDDYNNLGLLILDE